MSGAFFLRPLMRTDIQCPCAVRKNGPSRISDGARYGWRYGWILVIGWILVSQDSLAAKSRVQKVGPVNVTTALAPDDPKIGDEVQFEIKVEAEGDVEVLMPEFGEALDRYTILNFVPSRKVEADGSSVFTQRYTLQPYQSGEQSIPPILVEFVDHRVGQKPAPDDLDAYEVLTERLDFSVQSVLPEGASDELKPPLGELQLVSDSSAQRWYWFAAALLVGGVAVVAGLAYAAHRNKRISRQNAYEIARRRLDQLLVGPEPDTPEAVERFFVLISGIVRKYLEDRFELRAPDLTTEEFLELAGTADDLTHDHQVLLREFLRQADLVKFAAVNPSPDETKRSVDLAIRFLEETRENAPDIELDATSGAVSAGGASSSEERARA